MSADVANLKSINTVMPEIFQEYPFIKFQCMFLQRCFIKSDEAELVEKLEKLGYYCCNKNLISRGLLKEYYLVTEPDIAYAILWGILPETEITGEDTIDCGTDEGFFLALAALRDDTDKNQLFCSNYFDRHNKPDDWQLCTEDNYKDFFGDCPYMRNYDDYHKATVEEIIKHFKNN